MVDCDFRGVGAVLPPASNMIDDRFLDPGLAVVPDRMMSVEQDTSDEVGVSLGFGVPHALSAATTAATAL